MLSIQLVHSPNDSKYKNLQRGYDSFPPPVGLAVLASYLKRKLDTIFKIEIFDGNVSDVETIKSRLNGDYIGFSDWFTNHENSLSLAKIAKKNNPNATIIFGGPNASNLGQRILLNHKEVDFVVYGDGEEALLSIIEKKDGFNTWSRRENSIVFSGKRSVSITETVPFDFENIYETDIYKYKNNNDDIGLTPVPISSVRGCMKAVLKGRCSYCAIPRFSNVDMMPPALVWEQIQFLNQKYGIKYFFETADNFLTDGFHKKMLSQKPLDINVKFRVYSDFESLSHSDIDVLEKLGVEEIYVGLENIAHDVIVKAHRTADKEKIVDTISYFDKKNIKVFLPFLFGLPGESLESISENFNFAKDLLSICNNIKRVVLTLAIPLIGTKWFSELENNPNVASEYSQITGKDLKTEDQIDYETLSLLSLKYLTTVSFMDIYNILKQPLKNNPKIVSFSSLEDSIYHKFKLKQNAEINI
jgi:radical SAM superfamily enzyme YgiQ (UPF0313 family)